MSIAKRIDLSWITVSDLKKAKEFYTKILGFKISESHEDMNWIELVGQDGGMLLGITQAQEGQPGSNKAGSNAVVTIVVDAIATAKKELTAKGVTFYGDIIEVPGHVKLATFTDADGNMFQLVECMQKA